MRARSHDKPTAMLKLSSLRDRFHYLALESMEPVLEPAGYVPAPPPPSLPPPPPSLTAAWILLLYSKAISFPNGVFKVVLF